MKRLMFLLAIFIAAISVTTFGEPGKVSKASKQTSQTAVRVQRPTSELQGEVPNPARVDGDQAYKANCLRCHWEPRKFSERGTVTIVRHMRVIGNITEEEAEAILQYLTR